MSGFLTRLAVSLAAVLIALLAAVTAIGFFAYAVFLFLVTVMIPPWAALVTGAAVLIVAFLVILAARGLILPRNRGLSLEGTPLSDHENAALFGHQLGQKIHAITSAHKSSTALLALIGGIAVGASPRLRAFLLSLLKI